MVKDYSKEIKQAMCLHYSRLGEKDRRQYAAVEAIKLGYGGVTYIGNLLSVDRKTILEGKKELLCHDRSGVIAASRQRRQGGGRKKKGNPT